MGKIHAFENYDGLSVAKCALHIRALFILLARSFLAVAHFVILCSGYRFVEGIQ